MRDNSSRFAVPEESPETPEQPKIADLMSFTAPTQFVDLPSMGKWYPQGHPLHGQSSIEVKFMTAKEEDILASQELIKKGVVLDRLIQSLVIDKRIRPDDMLVGDKVAIMYAARISAYGPEYKTKFFCRPCSQAISHTFDLNDVKPEPEADFADLGVEEEDGKFSVTLPATKARVVMKLMTGADEKQMGKFIQKQKKNNDGLGALTTQMLFAIESINGATGKAQIMHFIENIPFQDSKFIRKVYKQISPSMDTAMKVTCSQCDEEQEVELPMSVDFFWPKQ
jgi:hypothetical protein